MIVLRYLKDNVNADSNLEDLQDEVSAIANSIYKCIISNFSGIHVIDGGSCFNRAGTETSFHG